ncbi:MAG TPA: TonB-dependent receptor [Casimicrobiaceae bacterium]
MHSARCFPRAARPLAWLLLYLAHIHADAQPAAVLDPVVVTAARMPQRLTDLLADVTVIGVQEIQRSGVQSLAELLQRQPGVEIVQNGGPGSSSGIFLRGANAAQTLVLIDGLRVASATAGATAIEAIPLDQIERIEILRGPSSSLYGADAIGGVIQVFTRKPTTAVQANATAGYGTHDTWLGTAGVSGGNDVVRGALQIGARRSAGFNAIVNPANFSYDPDRDGYRDNSLSAQATVTLADEHHVDAQYFRSRLNNQFDAGDAFDDRTITTLSAWQVALRDQLLPTWQSRLSAGEGEDESVSKTGFGDSPFRTRQRQYAWQNELAFATGHASHRVTLAVERREERVATDPPFPVTLRTTNAFTAVYAGTIGPHALQANLRDDDSNQYGNRVTGVLAYGYRLTPQWRITASAGTAFKAPTFNDLYFPGFSNPDLRPETARNIEAGGYYAAEVSQVRVEARAVAWHNRVRDLIVFQCDASFDCAPRNVSDATLKGITLGFDAVAPKSSAHVTLDLQSPLDDATGHLLPRRARRHGAVQLLQQAGPATLGAELVASSRRFDDAENLRPLGGYAILNLTAEWPVNASATLFVRADNVFDRNYELAADFSTGGARVFGGVRWRL